MYTTMQDVQDPQSQNQKQTNQMSETPTKDDAQSQAMPANLPQNIPPNSNIQVRQPYLQQQQQIPQQPYLVYYPQGQAGQYVQVHPAQYPQFQQNNQTYLPTQQPLLYQNQQYVDHPPQYQTVQPVEPLKHAEITSAGLKEKRYFNMLVMLSHLLIQSGALLFCTVSIYNDPINISYDTYSQNFKPIFWVFCTLLGISWLYGFVKSKFFRKSPYNVIHFLVLGITFAFVIQGIYSSCYYMDYYYYSYGSWYTLRSSDAANCILIALGFLCTATLSVAAYTFQEFDKLKLKKGSLYVSIPATLMSLIFIFFQTRILQIFLTALGAIAYGIYMVYLLIRANEKGMMKLKTNEYIHAAALMHFVMIFPNHDYND